MVNPYIRDILIKKYFGPCYLGGIKIANTNRPYSFGKIEVELMYKSLEDIGTISLKKYDTSMSHFFDIIDGQNRTTTLILMRKVYEHLTNTSLIEGYDNINYEIEDKPETADYENVDKYLNGEEVEFYNENYKTAIDTLLKIMNPAEFKNKVDNSKFTVIIN